MIRPTDGKGEGGRAQWGDMRGDHDIELLRKKLPIYSSESILKVPTVDYLIILGHSNPCGCSRNCKIDVFRHSKQSYIWHALEYFA